MTFSWGRGFPAEVQGEIAAAMGVDATIQDWMVVEAVCRSWRAGVAGALCDYFRGQTAGVRFCPFEGTEAERRFVGRHLDCEYSVKGRHSFTANPEVTVVRDYEGLYICHMVCGQRPLYVVVLEGEARRRCTRKCGQCSCFPRRCPWIIATRYDKESLEGSHSGGLPNVFGEPDVAVIGCRF
jgi:hypothetical protein